MRIVFMGTPPFAATLLETLIHSFSSVVAVYTQPPREAGRGYNLAKSAVHRMAEDHGIPVETPISLRDRDTHVVFKNYAPDVVIVVAYGLLLPQEILDVPSHGCLNVHASLLPRWRGAAPIERAILSGDHETGVCLMKMEKGLDTGPIIAAQSIPITSTTTADSLLNKMASVGKEVLLHSLPLYLKGSLTPVAQKTAGVIYAPKIEKEEARLDFSNDAPFLERQVRAFHPRPGAWFDWQGARYKVLAAHVVDAPFQASPGTVIGNPFVVACGKKALAIDVLQKAGSKPLPVDIFLRGHALPIGTCISEVF